MSQDLTVVQKKHKDLRGYLTQPGIKNNLMMALPRHLDPDAMIRVALTAATKQPLLLECTPESFASALMDCSEMGLLPNGRDLHLIPFLNSRKEGNRWVKRYEITVIPDYKGLIKLAYQSGQVKSIMAMAVRAEDDFKYKLGTSAFLDHVPADKTNPGALTHAWAAAELKEGGYVFVVLNASEVARHREASKSKESEHSPWNNYPDAMWAKTAVKKLSKFIPLSAQLERAINQDYNPDFGDMTILPGAFTQPTGGGDDAEPEPPKSKSEKLADEVSAKNGGKKPAEEPPPEREPGDEPPETDEPASQGTLYE